MKWIGRRESSNVEDMRGGGGARKGLALGGIGTIAVVIISLLLGKNPMEMLQAVGGGMAAPEQTQNAPASAAEEEVAAFVKVVLADNEDVWRSLFQNENIVYRDPKLVLFRNAVESGCGSAASSMGPFYCGADEKVYIDLAFCDELKNRFDAPGDFAIAYVIAHEVGHHVQNVLGISGKVHAMRERLSEEEYNKMSVKLELQADFLAGVWAHHAQKTKNILEEGDIEEALGAASAVGDDRLQKQSQGYVVPDAFTHGSSEQRMRWFKKGFQSGDINQGDTFGAQEL